MKLREYEPTEARFAAAWRSLRAILDRGFRWSDQVSEIVTFTYVSSASSHSVALAGSDPPLAVVCLDAQPDPATGAHESMQPVSWSWDDGTLTVTDVGALSGTYTVRLGILR